MLNEHELQAYFDRLGYQGPRNVGGALLTALHRAHLQRIPFENLDIGLGRLLDLSPQALLCKILLQKRGGFCYELNHAFGLLLQSLGFTVSRIAARVFNGTEYGPDFDHMLLLVEAGQQSWLADVGFGDCFRSPMPLNRATVHEPGVRYFLQHDGRQQFILMQQKQGAKARPQYSLRLQSYAIDDFAGMCVYQQTSPASHFTQKSICSIATVDGRISISNNKCISTKGNERHVHSIEDETEYRKILLDRFGISLAADADIQKLMSRH